MEWSGVINPHDTHFYQMIWTFFSFFFSFLFFHLLLPRLFSSLSFFPSFISFQRRYMLISPFCFIAFPVFLFPLPQSFSLSPTENGFIALSSPIWRKYRLPINLRATLENIKWLPIKSRLLWIFFFSQARPFLIKMKIAQGC